MPVNPFLKAMSKDSVKGVHDNGVAAGELRRMNFCIPDASPSLPQFPAITTHHLPERTSGKNRSLRGREHDPSFSCILNITEPY